MKIQRKVAQKSSELTKDDIWSKESIQEILIKIKTENQAIKTSDIIKLLRNVGTESGCVS